MTEVSSTKTTIDFHKSNVYQFTLHQKVLSILLTLQKLLVTDSYNTFGKTPESWSEYAIIMPGTAHSERRKPISNEFQLYCDTIYFPCINALLFGSVAWLSLIDHLCTFKLSTLNTSESQPYHNKSIYHMHLDHKIGILQKKNTQQKLKTRILFAKNPQDEVCKGGTVYLKNQPIHVFPSQNHYHAYTRERFSEYGQTIGNTRPMYVVPQCETHRAMPGEVFIHVSHPKSNQIHAIHAEANPFPKNRCLYVWDWVNIIDYKEKSFKDIPLEKILDLMKIVETTEGLHIRLQDLNDTIDKCMKLCCLFLKEEFILEQLRKCKSYLTDLVNK